MRALDFFILVSALSACAARPSDPVAVSQPGDAELGCDAIAEEIKRNDDEAIRLAGADEDIVNQNITAGAVGALVFWPALFAMDLSQAEQIELRALRDRNERLSRLLERKGC